MWTVNVSIVPDKCFTVVSNVNVQCAINLSVQPQCHPLLVDIEKSIQNKWDCIKTEILLKKSKQVFYHSSQKGIWFFLIICMLLGTIE